MDILIFLVSVFLGGSLGLFLTRRNIENASIIDLKNEIINREYRRRVKEDITKEVEKLGK